MKFVISESRLFNFIYEYLSGRYYPNYNWGPELHQFYKNDVKKHGYYDFDIDDTGAYSFLGEPKIWKDNEPNTLIIQPWVADNLDMLFGTSWKPVFVKWFEDNSGLSVDHVVVMTAG